MVDPWGKLDLGRGMLMLDHIKKTFRFGDQENQDHRSWTNKQLGIQSTPRGEDAEMMVLGDVKIEQKMPEPKPQSKLPSLLKLGAGIAMAATGVGVGTGAATAIPALIDLLKPPAVIQPTLEPTQPQVQIPAEEFDVEVKLSK